MLPHDAWGAVSQWEKGVSIVPRHPTDLASDGFAQSLRNAARVGVNYATFIIPLYQSNIYSSDIGRGPNTPSDDALITATNLARSLGMRVMYKIHHEEYGGQWRAYINPSDRAGWFRNYESILSSYARIAQQYGVAQITIGTELVSLTDPSVHAENTRYWTALIGRIRGLYSGKLTYSANWGTPSYDEGMRVGFWPSLDSIGISAYYNLHTGGDNSVSALRSAWHNINQRQVTPLYQRFHKPVVFTEVGYRSVQGAHEQPWNYLMGGSPDEREQANSYEALFSYWNAYSFMQGVHLWDWETDPNAGGPGTTSFTPQRKQAETIMANWFSGGTPSPAPPPSGPVSVSATARANGTITVNESSPVTVSIKNTGSSSIQVLADLEVYNGANQKVHQRFFESQALGVGETKNYSLGWTPKEPGTYRLKIGVFGNGWTPLYRWEDNALVMNVGSASSPSPPPDTPTARRIEIWWPVNGGSVSGTQPFKAIVPGLSLSSYQMYWQVDGDQLNSMADSAQEYPHKEAWVDLSNWQWRGSGPYMLAFVARDPTGVIIARKDIQIYVR